MLGYFYLLVALAAGQVKGFSGKSISRDVKSFGDNVFVNIVRMLICALIGAGVLYVGEGHCGFYLTPIELVLCISSAVCMCVFCVAWMAAYQNEAYMFLSIFGMLGTVVTCFCGVLFYNEKISVLQWLGILLLFVAVNIMSKYSKQIKAKKKIRPIELLVLVLGCVGSGIVDFLQKAFVSETAKSSASLNFYTYAFGLVMLLLIFALLSLGRKHIEISDKLLNCRNIIGYFGMSAFLFVNSIFKTMAVGAGLTTAQTYPALQGANLIVASILASILLKEKITLKSVIGMLCAFVAVIMITFF